MMGIGIDEIRMGACRLPNSASKLPLTGCFAGLANLWSGLSVIPGDSTRMECPYSVKGLRASDSMDWTEFPG